MAGCWEALQLPPCLPPPPPRPFVPLARRVSLAFEQALMVLFHYPDTWLEFARWHQHGGGGGAAAAAAVLEKGRRALPTSLALHFAAADLHEALGDAAAAKAIYEELVQGLDAHASAAPAGAGAGAAAPPAAQPKPEGGEGDAQQQQPADGAAAAAGQPPAAPEVKQEAAAGAAGTPPPDSQQQSQQAGGQLGEEAGTLAWIQYMRFARRTEGIMTARKVGSSLACPALWMLTLAASVPPG